MMRQISFIVPLLLLVISCAKIGKDDMHVTGNIEGLKKGWLYLQKIEDSVLTNIDSTEIRGTGLFTFTSELESPEVFYLYLDKADNNDINDRITFFGEKGTIEITTSWNQFEADAVISGSKSQNDYSEYLKMMTDFNRRDLELAQSAFSEKDSLKMDSIENLAERNFINRYRYLLNFSLTHPHSYATPYIAVTDGQEANPIFLDSIYNALPDSIANSKYGQVLGKMVEKL